MVRTSRYRKARVHDPLGSVAAFVARSAVVGLAVAVAIAVPVGVLTVRADDERAAESFDQVAAVVAGSVIAPQVTPALLAGEPAALDRMQRSVAPLIAAGSVAGVTVRNADGRVVWPRMPGESATPPPLGAGDLRALRSASVVPAPGADDARTVSAGIRDVDGTPALVDITGGTAPGSWGRFLPPTLAALLALEVVQVPLVYGLAHRVRRHRRTEASLALAVAEAADSERRRVAGAVHDYVIPEMTGLAYDLDAARLGSPGTAETAALLDRTARGLRQNIGELRSVVFDLVQTRAPGVGLDTALRLLGERLGGEGTGISVRVDAAEPLPRPVAELLYRCAQESLRNVATHSRADQVEIVVEQDHEKVTMTIDDDGCGFDETRMTEQAAAGHVGLRTLGDLVAQGGGSLTAWSAPGQGTRVAVTVPLTAAEACPEPVR